MNYTKKTNNPKDTTTHMQSILDLIKLRYQSKRNTINLKLKHLQNVTNKFQTSKSKSKQSQLKQNNKEKTHNLVKSNGNNFRTIWHKRVNGGYLMKQSFSIFLFEAKETEISSGGSAGDQ